MAKHRRIVVLTGAGISQAAGLRPYAGRGGVCTTQSWAQLATIEAFVDDAMAVWRVFGGYRAQVAKARPSPAHRALARLESQLDPSAQLTILTDNIDGLHTAAGSSRVVDLRGQVMSSRCSNPACDADAFVDAHDHVTVPACARCESPLRPNVVLFDEHMPSGAAELAHRAVRSCDLFVAIGVADMREQARSLAQRAKAGGARTVYVDVERLERLERLEQREDSFCEFYRGRVEELLPSLVGLECAA